MVDLIVHSAERGVPCVQPIAIEGILDAFKEARKRIGVDLACTLTIGLWEKAWEPRLAKMKRGNFLAI